MSRSEVLIFLAFLFLPCCKEPQDVALDAPTHFHAGDKGRIRDVTFTVRFVPKRAVEGNTPEPDRVQIDALRGSDHGDLRLEASDPRGSWAGYEFELRSMNREGDDIELRVHAR